MSFTLDPAIPDGRPQRQRIWLGTPGYWFCQLCGWGGVGFAVLTPLFLYQPRDAAEGVVLTLAIESRFLFLALGFAGSHLLRAICFMLLSHGSGLFRFVMRAAPWVLLMCAIQTFWLRADFLARASSRPGLPDDFSLTWRLSDVADDFNYFLALMVIWTGFYICLRHLRDQQRAKLDRSRLEAAVREAELRALKAQINPHFLFNSLNSLRALLPFEMEKPREVITRLADLLRASLGAGQESLIPLRLELETVENYLAIEQLRHQDTLQWRIDADPDVSDISVPPFLLQGLVENAVKHGICRLECGGEVLTEIRRAGDVLRLRVTNPGNLASPGTSGGVGLANIRARLELLFGPSASVALRDFPSGTVEALVELPIARTTTPST